MKILVTSSQPGNIIEKLTKIGSVDINNEFTILPQKQLAERILGCDAVISLLNDRIDQSLMESVPNLKIIANVAVGFDNIDIEFANHKGILVTNTPDVLTETTADLTFGLLITAARRIAEADQFIRQKKWTGFAPDLFLGMDVYGKTLGIIGFGRIGQAVARRAIGFGMKVIYSKSQNNSNSKNDHGLNAEAKSLGELLSISDFISINCPLTKETHHLIGRKELALMKKECILINTARGAVVDQKELISAIQNKKIKKVALDVFDDEPNVPDELIQADSVVLTPHIGSATIETRSKMADLAVSGIISAFSGQLPKNAVNPEIWPKFIQRIR